MKTVKLNDGTRMPCLAFGTGTALSRSDVTVLAAYAIKRGFTHLDTAQLYRNEETLGAAVVASGVPRAGLYITTKLGAVPEGQTVEDTLRESLQKLKMDYVDLFLIHNPKEHEGRITEVWKQMVEVKKKGLTRSVGVSNFDVKLLEEVLAVGVEAPSVNQIEYHPFVHAKLAPLLAFQAKHSIITASYGGLTPILPKRGDDSLAPARARLTAALDKLITARSSEGKTVSQSQILLKWLQQQGAIAVTTSTKESRIDEYLAIESLPDLTEGELGELRASFEGVHFRHFKLFTYMDD